MRAEPARAVGRAWWMPALAGLAAMLVGVGLARFAYTPLMPALIQADWFDAGEAAYLGAANLVGYLLGAIAARRLLVTWPPAWTLRLSMALATLTFLACAEPFGFAWFLPWRFLSGLVGAFIVVGAAPTILTRMPPERRGLAGGIVFTGVGIGIAASGVLVPALIRLGLEAAWLGLGAVAALLTLLAWPIWPKGRVLARPSGASTSGPWLRLVLPVVAVYGLDAFGLVPHMVFYVDYVARGLDQGVTVGSLYWVVFGLGAVCGPLAAGRLGDRIGFRPAIRAAMALQLVAVALPVLAPVWPLLVLSAFVMGAFTPGMPPLVLGRIQELTRGSDAGAGWGVATIAFALAQAAGAWLMSFLYARTGSYPLLFALAAGAMALGLLLTFLDRRG